MGWWRLAVTGVLGLLVGVPLALPFVTACFTPDAWEVRHEAELLGHLARNSLLLAGGSLALALPVGVPLAALLYRTDLPLARPLRAVNLLALFVPLPLFTAGWQAALDLTGLMHVLGSALRFAEPGDAGWTPWLQGLVPAAVIHAAAALPWVVWVCGQGFVRVERHLEEDAWTHAGLGTVFWRVTLPRASASVAAAALWVVVLASTEVVVTNLMVVRTFAEDVYLQELLDKGQERAVLASAPWVAGLAGLIAWGAWRWERGLPAGFAEEREPLTFPLGRVRRWVVAAFAACVVVGLALVPVASLVWRCGAAPRAGWSARVALASVEKAVRSDGVLLLQSLAVALMAGALVATLALAASWLARERAWTRGLLVGLAALAWAVPGPVVGIALKDVIHPFRELPVLEEVLYRGTTPVPLVWADLVRFFPVALAVLWPVVRGMPRELIDAARVEGARPWQEFALVVWPWARPTWLCAALAVAVLSLGELSAGKLVASPRWQSYAAGVFAQMHFGVTGSLAAQCLLLLAAVLGGAAVLGLVQRRFTSTTPPR